LGRFPDSTGDDRHWVLQSDSRNGGFEQGAYKVECLLLLALFELEPSRAGNSKMRAWRMGNHHVPALVKDLAYVANVMLTVVLRWQNITRPRIMPKATKCIPDYPRELACN
jgi:hypothetical protein